MVMYHHDYSCIILFFVTIELFIDIYTSEIIVNLYVLCP